MIEVVCCKAPRWIFFKNFSYVVYDVDSKIGLVVDPAWNYKLINNVIKNNAIDLKGILVTHTHFDHINLVNMFVKNYNCDVYVSDQEIRYSNFQTNNMITINNDNTFYIGNINVSPIFTPGHSPGSTCYLISNNLFTGDTIFIEGCGMCYGDKKLANPKELYCSIQKIKEKIPGNVHIYPGHSYGEAPGQSMKKVLQNNIYLNFTNEKDFINYRTRKGQKKLFNFK